MNTHEDFSRKQDSKGPSDRSFGVVFAVFFALVTIVRPALLHPANVVWMRFGLLLSRIVNPIVMAVLFYGVITPVGWLKRKFGEDSMHLERDPNAASYWIERRPPGPTPETMSQQF